MDKKIIILIAAILIIGLIIGYILIPMIFQSTSAGTEVFGSTTGVSPPSLP